MHYYKNLNGPLIRYRLLSFPILVFVRLYELANLWNTNRDKFKTFYIVKTNLALGSLSSPIETPWKYSKPKENKNDFAKY